MYGKIFTSMYDGTLSEHWQALVSFQQMICLCNRDGVVDMTVLALSKRTGIPVEIYDVGIPILEAPDPESRAPDKDGCRIVRLDEHRAWGWQIVNHEFYRKLGSRADKKERDRLRMEKIRNDSKLVACSRSQSQDDAYGRHLPRSVRDVAHTDTDTDTDTKEQAFSDADEKGQADAANALKKIGKNKNNLAFKKRMDWYFEECEKFCAGIERLKTELDLPIPHRYFNPYEACMLLTGPKHNGHPGAVFSAIKVIHMRLAKQDFPDSCMALMTHIFQAENPKHFEKDAITDKKIVDAAYQAWGKKLCLGGLLSDIP